MKKHFTIQFNNNFFYKSIMSALTNSIDIGISEMMEREEAKNDAQLKIEELMQERAKLVTDRKIKMLQDNREISLIDIAVAQKKIEIIELVVADMRYQGGTANSHQTTRWQDEEIHWETFFIKETEQEIAEIDRELKALTECE